MLDPEIAGVGWGIHILTGGATATAMAVYMVCGVVGGWVGSWIRGGDKTKKALEEDVKTQEAVIGIIDKHIGITDADKNRRLQEILGVQQEPLYPDVTGEGA